MCECRGGTNVDECAPVRAGRRRSAQPERADSRGAKAGRARQSLPSPEIHLGDSRDWGCRRGCRSSARQLGKEHLGGSPTVSRIFAPEKWIGSTNAQIGAPPGFMPSDAMRFRVRTVNGERDQDCSPARSTYRRMLRVSLRPCGSCLRPRRRCSNVISAITAPCPRT